MKKDMRWRVRHDGKARGTSGKLKERTQYEMDKMGRGRMKGQKNNMTNLEGYLWSKE